MYKQFVILILILSSCSSARKIESNNKSELMSLDFLHNYRTSTDTIGNRVVLGYQALGLKEERTGKQFVILLQEDTIFIGNSNKYQYLFEVFQGTHLLISFVEGSSVASGPDLFERNNVFIIDLKEAILNEINLSNIHLTRSVEYLLMAHTITNKEMLERQSFKYCAINSIDLQNNKLVLLDQSNSLIVYKTVNISRPYRCK